MIKSDNRTHNVFRDLSAKQIEQAIETALESLIGKPVLVRVDGLSFDNPDGYIRSDSLTLNGLVARVTSKYDESKSGEPIPF